SNNFQRNRKTDMRLYIIRHASAQSASEANVSDDSQRPLSEKGIAEAQLLGAYLKSKGVRLDLVLHSPLVRATETAQLLSEKVGCRAIPENRLSTECGVRTHLDVLSECKQIEHLAIIGHQPTLGELIVRLDNFDRPFSPGSMVVMDISFSDRGAPAGKLVSVHSPETM
ncbi:MAG: phosphohistidine phosphatase SixA, partial [Chlorobiales bacterium]|nr:phosphohistidine phosphatase SixA [Chlorobiales bacterium]